MRPPAALPPRGPRRGPRLPTPSPPSPPPARRSPLHPPLPSAPPAPIRRGGGATSAVPRGGVPGAETVGRRVLGGGGGGMPTGHRLIRRWAWPSADWGSLPVEGGIEAAYRAELEAADDPAATLAGIRARLDAVRSPLRTAERFGIEEIIDPRATRPLLCDWVRDAYAALPASPRRPSFGTRP